MSNAEPMVPWADDVEDLDALADVNDEWRPEGVEDAERAMARLLSINEQLNALEAQAERFRSKVQAWYDHAAKTLEARKAWYEDQLCSYALAVRRDSHDQTKRVYLPSGVIETTKTNTRVTIDDPAAVLEWAEANRPEIITVKRSVMVSNLKNVVGFPADSFAVVDAETGERIPGAMQVPGSVSAVVKPLELA